MFPGETLIKKQHRCSREVQTALERLMSLWKNLLEESANRGRGLEEAQDILEFNNQVDKIEAWIRDKVSGIQFLLKNLAIVYISLNCLY